MGSPGPRSRKGDGKAEALWRGTQRARVCVECETARLLVLLTERVDEGVVVCAGTSCPRVCTARCVWCAWEWACIELLTLCGFERVTGSVYLLRVGVCVS